tara:strand:- start:198 stop:1385 length:1188 start_codon:yes stop_codon:yes gene_type:complete
MLENFQISKSIFVFIKINFFLIVSLNIIAQNNTIIGIDKTEEYLPLIIDKNVAIVSNHTSHFIKENKSIHFVDSLLKLNVQVKKVFAPEHGFRGNLDAGEKIINSIDSKTGIPIVSLYGKKRKPSFEDLDGIDVIIFDIQDVGARFYTYLSTMHYVMESCAENGIKLIVLDRPNPNGHYIDGPVMTKESMSFVGLHPVPIVYGMTIGEYAKMINGEKWLKNNLNCKLKVIEITNYNRYKKYKLSLKPSPNLPNQKSINLYPSLCFFEQTPVSVGRGTKKQFQVIGTPYWKNFKFNFTPKSMPGAKYPKHENYTCYGLNLENEQYLSKIDLKWLILAYKNERNKDNFFKSGFHRLAGSKLLEEQIKKGLSEKEIKKTWKNGLENFQLIREKYLIYN